MEDIPVERARLSTTEPSPGLWLPVVVLMVAPILVLPLRMFTPPGTGFGGPALPPLLIETPLDLSFIWVALASVGVLSRASNSKRMAWVLVFTGWCLSNSLVMLFRYEPWLQSDRGSVICAISIALKPLLVPSLLTLMLTYLALPIVTGLVIKSAQNLAAKARPLDSLGITILVVSLLPLGCLFGGDRYAAVHPLPRHAALQEVVDELNKLQKYEPAKQAQPTQPGGKQP